MKFIVKIIDQREAVYDFHFSVLTEMIILDAICEKKFIKMDANPNLNDLNPNIPQLKRKREFTNEERNLILQFLLQS